MQLNGFSGWISIDDNPVTEYAIEVGEARKTASCWIPSEVGKTFSVQWNNLSYNGTDTSARVSIDGTRCGRVVQRLERQHIPGAMNGVKQFDGGAKVRPFTFSTLATTDDDDALLLPDSISEHLGVIELSFIRYTSSSSRLGATGKRKASDEPSVNPSTAKRGKTVMKSEFDEAAGSDESKGSRRHCCWPLRTRRYKR
uniref:DUF7918 domain-containing protein n=1 Tax=Mycena chlorophos TaxID=658473 RepID=A0ABQ0LVN0_MYCCL|nr:predicted protein [Mycena chlorophos]